MDWKRRTYKIVLAVVFFFLAGGRICYAQTRQMDYINQYMGMAVGQMQKYKIPASITLAQGLLESAAGTSRLAMKGNNHFGIKCGLSWKGPYMLVNDDAPNEHFRVYASAEQSYEDHSLFLRQNQRYSRLFSLRITDYKGWAHGLKAAGYATNPNYAYSLIQLIENYDLYKIDETVVNGTFYRKQKTDNNQASVSHKVYMCNKNFYVVAREGDTFKSIAKEMGLSQRKLCKYNEVDKHYVLQPGEVVFLLEKQKKADKSLKGVWHRVSGGESMHSISQHYGMRVKTLYKNNFHTADYVPREGDLLLVR